VPFVPPKRPQRNLNPGGNPACGVSPL
jgi:hypothetical protein